MRTITITYCMERALYEDNPGQNNKLPDMHAPLQFADDAPSSPENDARARTHTMGKRCVFATIATIVAIAIALGVGLGLGLKSDDAAAGTDLCLRRHAINRILQAARLNAEPEQRAQLSQGRRVAVDHGRVYRRHDHECD